MCVHGTEGVWHTAQGIGLGTSLSTLERLNGRPFHFRSLLSKVLIHTQLTFAGAMHSQGYNRLSEVEHQEAEADGKLVRFRGCSGSQAESDRGDGLHHFLLRKVDASEDGETVALLGFAARLEHDGNGG